MHGFACPPESGKAGRRVRGKSCESSAPSVAPWFWSSKKAGPSPLGVRLDPPAAGDETILNAFLRPDGEHLLIQFLDQVATTARAFTVPVAGPATAAILLADETPGGCTAFAADFTPDSTRLLYAGFCPPGSVFTQLWSVPATGPATAAVSLAGSFTTGGTVQGLAISPDSQRVVFSADRLVDERIDLWSVPILGPAAALVQLNPSLVTNGDVKNSFRISPDSTRVAYIADQISDERFFPYSVPIAGPSTEAVTLYQGILMTGGDALDLAFTPDSARVVFRMDLAVDQRFDLYWAPADGSAAQSRITNRGSNPAPERSVAFRWYVHPDGERVLYQFDELAALDERGIGEQRLVGPYIADARLNGVPVAGGKVTFFELFPDGAGLVYRADETVDEKFELFTADLRLLGDGFEEGSTAAWADLPRDTTAVGLSPLAAPICVLSGMSTPYSPGSTPCAAGAPLALAMLLLLPVGAARAQLSLPPDYAWRQFSPPGEAGSSVRYHWKIDPRGEWVVFVGDVENAGAEAVYAMRRNGAALYRLSAYGAPGSIAELLLSGDGRRVIYRGDLETDGRNELWSAPISGNSSQCRQAQRRRPRAKASSTGPCRRPENVSSTPRKRRRGIRLLERAARRTCRRERALDSVSLRATSFVGTAISPEGARAFLVLGDIAGQTSRIWSAPIDGPIGSGLFLFDATLDQLFRHRRRGTVGDPVASSISSAATRLRGTASTRSGACRSPDRRPPLSRSPGASSRAARSRRRRSLPTASSSSSAPTIRSTTSSTSGASRSPGRWPSWSA